MPVKEDAYLCYLLQARRLRRVEIVHAVPDRLQNPIVKGSEMNIRSHKGNPSHYVRGKRRHTDTTTDEQYSLVFQEVLACASKWSVYHNPREDTIDGRRDNQGPRNVGAFLTLARLLVQITSECLRKCACEVANDSDVN